MVFFFMNTMVIVLLLAFVLCILMESPFRIVAKLIFTPPKKTIRLKSDLAKELYSREDGDYLDNKLFTEHEDMNEVIELDKNE